MLNLPLPLNNKIYLYTGGAVLVIVASLAIWFGVRNKILNHDIAKRDSQIETLKTEINQLKGEKIVIAKQATDAVANFEAQKKRAETAEAKLAKLKPVKLPPVAETTTAVTVSPECMEQIKIVSQQYEAREETFNEVIVEQKATIVRAEEAIVKLQDEVKLANQIIAKHEEKDKQVDGKISDLEKKLGDETSKKKIYRTTTGVLGVIVLILLL